jgi:uncharacterized protein (UPF0276 family)
LLFPHFGYVATSRPAVAWLEIHPENFLANPHAREVLLEIAEHYPISVHTVGISIGSAGGIDRVHLARVRELIELVDPILVSGHLAWSTHEGEYLNDLLPLPYTQETIQLLARHIDIVQEGLGRPYLVENPSSYVGFESSTMSEVEFLCDLVHRCGCRLLCDVSNIYLSGRNMGFDPFAYIDALPAGAIGELHLGGFTVEQEHGRSDAEVLIDTHSARIAEPVWRLYAHAVRRFGFQPTLIEWDNEIPAFATILGEAARANAVAAQALEPEAHRARAR